MIFLLFPKNVPKFGCFHLPPDLSSLPSTSRRKRCHWEHALDAATLCLPRTRECFALIMGDPKLDYDLPVKPNMTAGKILVHCYEALDKILETHWPCIYKVGVTHCAHFRFYNSVFGYCREKDQWQHMVVVYAASEPISPAFVEGAMIQRHKGSFH